jgi:hypothetical protein
MWPERSSTANMNRGRVGKGMAGGCGFEKRLKQTAASEP